MNAYYDTGALVPLYAEEVFSATVNAFMEGRREPVPLNLFQRLELENAMRLKVFRGEMDADFVTADERQLQAARREGLRVVDVRALHRRHGDDRAAPGVTLRESRARYGAQKRGRG